MKASGLITLSEVGIQDKDSCKTASSRQNNSKLFAYSGAYLHHYFPTRERRKVYPKHTITSVESATTLLNHMRLDNAECCFADVAQFFSVGDETLLKYNRHAKSVEEGSSNA